MTETALKSRNVLRYFLPSAGAQEARRPDGLWPALWVYAAFLAATAIFYAYKPFDFPERNAPYPQEIQGIWFWAKVMCWQPALEAMWIVFLVALVEWMREGRLLFKLACAVLAAAFPFILMVAYKQDMLGRLSYIAAAILWLAALTPLLRRATSEQWRVIAVFMLGLNIVGLGALIPMQAAIWLDSEGLFKAAQIAGGLWILVAGTLGLRSLTGLRLPRCFMSILLSMFMQIAFAFTLHLLGLVPKDILKALLYA